MNNIYCTYRHIRLDINIPFYIGMGDIKRPYSKANRNKFWHDIVNLNPNYRIDILFENLTWKEACEKEIEFIALYGRRNLKRGQLVNLTDGGDGTKGRKHSKESI